jgi:DNA-binding NtrC family response regulator
LTLRTTEQSKEAKVEPAKAHILIVDDEDALRHLITDHLTHDGFDVDAASCAAEAAEKLIQTPYDVVVTDLVLPDKSGVALLEETLLRSPGTIVIMMTGHATIETAVEAMKKGAYEYLTKPFQLIQLTTIIRNGLTERSLRSESKARSSAVPFIELPEEGIDFQHVVAGIERELIVQSLRRTNGNKKLAAKLLSLKRTTLIEKIKRIGLDERIATSA